MYRQQPMNANLTKGANRAKTGTAEQSQGKYARDKIWRIKGTQTSGCSTRRLKGFRLAGRDEAYSDYLPKGRKRDRFLAVSASTIVLILSNTVQATNLLAMDKGRFITTPRLRERPNKKNLKSRD